MGMVQLNTQKPPSHHQVIVHMLFQPTWITRGACPGGSVATRRMANAYLCTWKQVHVSLTPLHSSLPSWGWMKFENERLMPGKLLEAPE
jgi:hypothetical protein